MTIDENALDNTVQCCGLSRVHTKRIIETYEQAKRENAPDVLHATDEKSRQSNVQGEAGDVRVLHVTTTDQFPEAGKMVEAGHSEQQLDMVERVAKVIQKSGHVEVDALTLQQLGIKPLEWTDFVEDAKAAIAAMGSEQVQLGSKLNLSEELETALKHLVALKDYKEAAGGKTLYYEREQPLAWEQARQVLVAAEERRSMSSEQVQNRDTLNLSEGKRLSKPSEMTFSEQMRMFGTTLLPLSDMEELSEQEAVDVMREAFNLFTCCLDHRLAHAVRALKEIADIRRKKENA